MHKINDEKLSELFGTQPISDAEIIDTSNSLTAVDDDHDFVEEEFASELDFDIAVARKNILNAITTSKGVLESAGKVAIDTEHPKVYESYSALLKSVTDASNALLNLHVQKKTIEKSNEKKDESSGTVTNNNTAVFVGTPAELRQLLKDSLPK